MEVDDWSNQWAGKVMKYSTVSSGLSSARFIINNPPFKIVIRIILCHRASDRQNAAKWLNHSGILQSTVKKYMNKYRQSQLKEKTLADTLLGEIWVTTLMKDYLMLFKLFIYMSLELFTGQWTNTQSWHFNM